MALRSLQDTTGVLANACMLKHMHPLCLHSRATSPAQQAGSTCRGHDHGKTTVYLLAARQHRRPAMQQHGQGLYQHPHTLSHAPAPKDDQLVVVRVIDCHMSVTADWPIPSCRLQVPLHALAGHPEQLVADSAVLHQLAPKHIYDVVDLQVSSTLLNKHSALVRPHLSGAMTG